jgi:hypothetical protein
VRFHLYRSIIKILIAGASDPLKKSPQNVQHRTPLLKAAQQADHDAERRSLSGSGS